MQIEIVNVGAPYKDGKFFKLDLKYVRDGKESARKLVAVGDTKNVFEVIKQANPGEAYEIELKKDGEYYNWVGAVPVTSATAGSAPATAGQRTAIKSTYETPEERQLRQLYIARQSSVANAIKFFEANKAAFGVKDVIGVAKEFVQFVYQTDEGFSDE